MYVHVCTCSTKHSAVQIQASVVTAEMSVCVCVKMHV